MSAEAEADTEGTKSTLKCDGKFSPPVEEDEPKILKNKRESEKYKKKNLAILEKG